MATTLKNYVLIDTRDGRIVHCSLSEEVARAEAAKKDYLVAELRQHGQRLRAHSQWAGESDAVYDEPSDSYIQPDDYIGWVDEQ